MNNNDKLKIIEEYEILINKYAYSFYNSIKGSDISKEDIVSEIKIGLLNDLDGLDVSKSKSVFIENSIKRTCLKYINRRNRLKRGNGLQDDSLNRPIADEGDNVDLIDVIAHDYDLENSVVEDMLVKDILNFVDNINHKEGIILRMYSEGYTFREIGDNLGITKQRANQIFGRTIKKVRKHFKEVAI